MAKKKITNSRSRGRQFKYATPTSGVAPVSSARTENESVASSGERDFSYVGRDLRRILLSGGALLATQLILWFVFDHTGLGAAVYRLVHV